MKEEEFLNSIEDLTGRVAIVTGGARGIGVETSIYLAFKGATVYIASRDSEVTHAGVAEARRRLKSLVAATATGNSVNDDDLDSRIKYHDLDLVSMKNAWDSAQEFKKKEKRLDILVCNAGISMTTMENLSPDGFDLMFAVNHLGNFAFILGLIDLIKETAEETHDGRVVLVNSAAYKMATKLDYQKLTTQVPNDGQTVKAAMDAFKRYGDSKLASVYGSVELCSRLRQTLAINDVYVNICHPGSAINTTLGSGNQKGFHPAAERVIRSVLGTVIGNTTADSAKTQVYLAGSKYVKEHDIYGEFWFPKFSMIAKAYKSCGPEEYTAAAKDVDEQKKLWKVTVETFEKAVGKETIDSAELVKKLVSETGQ